MKTAARELRDAIVAVRESGLPGAEVVALLVDLGNMEPTEAVELILSLGG